MSFLLLLSPLGPAAANGPDWLEPNICNAGTGWETIPDPYKRHRPPEPHDNLWKGNDVSIVVRKRARGVCGGGLSSLLLPPPHLLLQQTPSPKQRF